MKYSNESINRGLSDFKNFADTVIRKHINYIREILKIQQSAVKEMRPGKTGRIVL
jgi:hypothetical protein